MLLAMLQILRKIACNEADSLGDVSTLADPSIVQILIDKVAEAKDPSAQVRRRTLCGRLSGSVRFVAAACASTSTPSHRRLTVA